MGYTQVYNDLWTARFTLPADDPKNKYCQPFNYVEIFDDKRRIELFRIKGEDLERAVKGFKTYLCEHVIITLIDDVLFQFHKVGNIGVFTPEAINYVLSHQVTRNWVLGRCDFMHQFLYKWESENLLAALFSIPRPFAGEWHITYDTTAYPWTVNILRAETEIGCEIRRRKNMQGITVNKDVKNLVTKIVVNSLSGKVAYALLCGGNWTNGVQAGARTANVNNWPWHVNTSNGVRLACDFEKSEIL